MRTALTKVDGIADIKTNHEDNTCSFKAPKDLDVEKTLNEIAEGGNHHIKGWSLDESATKKKKEGVGTTTDNQTVSLKLPNMT